jgi:hypothetical protein
LRLLNDDNEKITNFLHFYSNIPLSLPRPAPSFKPCTQPLLLDLLSLELTDIGFYAVNTLDFTVNC